VNKDLSEFTASLASHNVEFLVVGSTVLAFYARPRFTEDIDFWVRPTAENIERLADALIDFGFPVKRESPDRFWQQDRQMIILGAKPQAIGPLNFLGGATFDEAWENRKVGQLWGTPDFFLGLRDFIVSRRKAGRPKDLADLALLEEVLGQSIDDFLEP